MSKLLRRPRITRRGLLVFLIGAYLGGGAYLAFTRLVDSGFDLGAATAGLPISLISRTENPPDWSSKERVNILLLGADARPGQDSEATRTDTMMVLSLDPITPSASLLSIPRDLYVPIPLASGRQMEDRINTASVYGEAFDYPGGGTALAKATVQYNLGIPIHYYVLVDFEGFKRIVDTLGGVEVELEYPLVDYNYPTANYGVRSIYIPAGRQTLSGEQALWYARSRSQNNDLGRMHRQQQLMMAMRDKALRVNIVPKIPSLFADLGQTVKTDLSLGEVVKLADIANDVKTENIFAGALDEQYVMFANTPGGASVLVPRREEMGHLIAELFFDARLRQEGASVEVLDTSGRDGLASRSADRLLERGFPQVRWATDGQKPQPTTIYAYTGKRYSAEQAALILQLPPDRIRTEKDPNAGVDLRIVLGDDAPDHY